MQAQFWSAKACIFWDLFQPKEYKQGDFLNLVLSSSPRVNAVILKVLIEAPRYKSLYNKLCYESDQDVDIKENAKD